MESLLSLFQNRYAARMRERETAYRTGALSPPSPAFRGNTPLPHRLPQGVWEQLNPAQRWATVIQKSWKERLQLDKVAPPSTEALARRAFPVLGTSREAAALFISILGISKNNTLNPTLSDTALTVRRAVDYGEPLTFFVSQCLDKAPEVRPAKLDFYTGRRHARVELPRVTAGLESSQHGIPGKGWVEMRALVQSSAFPIRFTLLLADMDPLTIDGGYDWLSPNSIRQLGDEVRRLQEQTQSSADIFFGRGVTTVRRWSELYSYDDFRSGLPRAMATESWAAPRALDDALMLYEQYGYRRLERELGIQSETMQRFIVGDICRTAAQYRLEADIVRREGVIQGWAESVPKRLWPIQVSNYDGAGFVPSVLFI